MKRSINMEEIQSGMSRTIISGALSPLPTLELTDILNEPFFYSIDIILYNESLFGLFKTILSHYPNVVSPKYLVCIE